ncbi:MAG: class I SAM-dependent methyltransferase, partial [Eubacteriales bacterium]|nr:class I SAM-dependent methyltransferase [Eubacteriales bacterium]
MQYMEEILMWNEKVNLTGITDRDEFVQKHFIDSLLV